MGFFDFLKKKTIAATPTVSVTTKVGKPQVAFQATELSANAVSQELKREFVVIDTETTGLSARQDKIIEIGAVRFVNGEPVGQYSALINIGQPIPAAATRVNHITDDMLIKEGKAPDIVYQELMDFLGPDVLSGRVLMVAYNAKFDFDMLCNTMRGYPYRASIRYVDALAYARERVIGLSSYKQDTLIRHFNIENTAAHRASSDAEACGRLLHALLNLSRVEVIDEEAETLKELMDALKIEEQETIAVIYDIMAKGGINPDAYQIYKTTQSAINFVGETTDFRFKIGQKERYVLLDKRLATVEAFKVTDCPEREHPDFYKRVHFKHSVDLYDIASEICKSMENAKAYFSDGISLYESKFYDKQTLLAYKCFDIKSLTASAYKTKEETLEKEKEAAIQAKIDIQKAKEESQQKKAIEAAEKKEAIQNKKDEMKRIQQEQLENAQSYTMDEIHAIINRSAESRGRAIIKMDDELHIIKVYESVNAASNDNNISSKTIRSAAKGDALHAAGFRWMYADEFVKNN